MITRKGMIKTRKNMITIEGTNKPEKKVAEFKELYHQEDDELHKEGDELL
jgi:hypothetical protein